jgi:hypothetical protein
MVDNIYDDDIMFVYQYTTNYLKLIYNLKSEDLIQKEIFFGFLKMYFEIIDYSKIDNNENLYLEYMRIDQYNNYKIIKKNKIIDVFNNYYDYKIINNRIKYLLPNFTDTIRNKYISENKNIKIVKYFLNEFLSLESIPDILVINNIYDINNFISYILIKEIIPQINEFKNMKIYASLIKNTNDYPIEIEVINNMLPFYIKKETYINNILNQQYNKQIIEDTLNGYRHIKDDPLLILKIDKNQLFFNNNILF